MIGFFSTLACLQMRRSSLPRTKELSKYNTLDKTDKRNTFHGNFFHSRTKF